ncbi:MAG: hypothetical protein K1060chlam5_00960 [Candidatus Anoxychlamydiales bacterium]|nr:hypothetical protein [Candidatus Anoxychlamydiales bacterium]
MKDLFLEKLGLYLINKKNRYIIFFTIIFLFAASFTISYMKYMKIKAAEDKFIDISLFANDTLIKRKNLKDFINSKVNSDSNYLEVLEKLNLKQSTVYFLNSTKTHIAFENNSSLENRLNFLTSKENKINFKEEKFNSTEFIKETFQKLISKVEVDESDLIKILSIIENESENKPQLIITDFKIDKANSSSFLLDLNILKREFYKKL